MPRYECVPPAPVPTKSAANQNGSNSHLYLTPDGPSRLSTIFVVLKFEMSTIARVPSLRPGMLEADAVARVCPEDSATGIGDLSEETVLRAESV
jgi:hypothetical protein